MNGLDGPSAAEWNGLAAATGNIFATRDWLASWWAHFGEGAEPVIVTDSDSAPTVIWPLMQNGRLVRQLRLIGHGDSDRLGPVCAPESDPIAGEVLKKALARGKALRWDALLLHDVEPDRPWAAHLPLQRLREVASPSVTFPDCSWDAYLKTKSKNFREQARRKEARLRKDFTVTFRLATRETLDTDLETLFHLHSERWGVAAPFAAEQSRAFHLDFAARALTNDWLRLWILELDDEPVAACYCFRFAGSEYYYQGGRDPRYDKHSVGFALMIHVLREACDAGVDDFRLLRGDEGYKTRFATESRMIVTFAAASGPVGAASLRFAQLRRAARGVPEP